MCIVMKQGYEYIPTGDEFSNFNFPLKIETLPITPEANLLAAIRAAGLTPTESEAALRLVRDLPRATTDVERKNFIVSEYKFKCLDFF